VSDTIQVEVAYALPDKQRIVRLDVPSGTTALQAVSMSQLDEVFEELVIGPDINLGVWGKAVTGDRVLATGERVEIYRPLLIDPKEVRKARAARAKAAREGGDQASAAVSGSTSADSE
jgi:putative ubiquitin-RnfH superfamily antitoxin RatB of RatAB toxin-antitoxin module